MKKQRIKIATYISDIKEPIKQLTKAFIKANYPSHSIIICVAVLQIKDESASIFQWSH